MKPVLLRRNSIPMVNGCDCLIGSHGAAVESRRETGWEVMKHESAVTSAQFSPDGQRVVTASVDTTARLWNALAATIGSA
jgi:WD40 repeat protein